MAKKVPIDKLQQAVREILDEYGDNIRSDLQEAVKKVTKAGVTAVKGESRAKFGGTGKYAKGWTSTMETGRISAQGTIYNNIPGLPHLLENGHAKRGGGRVPGRAHIAPVENQIVEQFQKEVERRI